MLAGIAGFFGTILRFILTRYVNHALPGFPWGTLLVNVAGAFIAGFLFVYCRAKFQAYEEYFPVIFIGFLGAFTTFSTFALESARFCADAQYTPQTRIPEGSGIFFIPKSDFLSCKK